MTPEKLDELRRQQLATLRFDYLFREAWYSIALERGYRFDNFLTTSSRGTLAIRSLLHANGV